MRILQVGAFFEFALMTRRASLFRGGRKYFVCNSCGCSAFLTGDELNDDAVEDTDDDDDDAAL